MNIDNLTFSELKQIAALFNQFKAEEKPDELVGKYVLVRCYSAGVHAGELVSQKGDVVELKDSRRLWQWVANDGIALSGVAQCGLKGGKLDHVNPFIRLTGVIETISCSGKSKASINDFINK